MISRCRPRAGIGLGSNRESTTTRIAKTTKVGKTPVKFQLGAEYSVVSQDDFGKRFLIKLNVIPMIGALVKSPIFGGG